MSRENCFPSLTGNALLQQRRSAWLPSSPTNDDHTDQPFCRFTGLPQQRCSERALSRPGLCLRGDHVSPGARGHRIELLSADVRQTAPGNRRNQRGVAVVEFALVLPLFLLITFGTIEFGLVMYDAAVITNASREAARYGIKMDTPKYNASQIQQVAINYCSNYLISLTGGGTTCPAANVKVTGEQGAFGTPLSVTVSYQFNPLPLGKLFNPMSGALSLSATTVMDNE